MSLCKVTTGNPSNTSKFCKARLLDSKHSFFYRLLLVKFLNKTCFLIQVRAGGTAKIHSKNMPTLPWLWRLNWLFLICIHDRLPMFSGEALVLQAKPKVCNFNFNSPQSPHVIVCIEKPIQQICALFSALIKDPVVQFSTKQTISLLRDFLISCLSHQENLLRDSTQFVNIQPWRIITDFSLFAEVYIKNQP